MSVRRELQLLPYQILAIIPQTWIYFDHCSYTTNMDILRKYLMRFNFMLFHKEYQNNRKKCRWG